MTYFFNILAIMESLLFIYLTLAGIYILVFALAGNFRKKRGIEPQSKMRKIAVLIPSYKEDTVICSVVNAALQQQYPMNCFDIVVIADSFKPGTLRALRALPINLIEVSFTNSTKSKALNTALKQLNTAYDIALVLDADNIMESQFLYKVNAAFNNGFKIVQGRRVAKNNDSAFAILDGISEAVNNHIFRQGHRALGLSSGLIGSGMAFDFQLFKSLMSQINAIGGFDKELEFRLFQQGHTIEYLSHATVQDEKVGSADDFKNQRRRWLSTNGVYLSKFLVPAIKASIRHRNIDLLDKLYQMTMPPRVLLLGGVILFTVIRWVFHVVIPEFSGYITPLLWLGTTLMVISAFILAIPRNYYNRKTLKAMIALPKAFALMFMLLFKLRGANKRFIHTKHTTV